MKIVALGDLHVGHLLGLTPPQHMRKFELSDLMEEYWAWFVRVVPTDIDVLIVNGDILDGEGRHETSFHLTTDINEQCDIASEIIEMIGAKQNVFVFGTPYHCGRLMDYEKIIADRFGGNIKAKQRCSFNGVRFDISHHTGKTSTPVGGDIVRKKAIIWNMLHDHIANRNSAHYILRSHIHEYGAVENAHACAITLPGLQLGCADFNRYARKMEGSWYDVGFLEFECNSETDHRYTKHIFDYAIERDEYVEYKPVQE